MHRQVFRPMILDAFIAKGSSGADARKFIGAGAQQRLHSRDREFPIFK